MSIFPYHPVLRPVALCFDIYPEDFYHPEGRNGWLVPHEDVEALSNRIVEITMDRKWTKLPERELLPERFRREQVVGKYEEVLKNF